MLDTYSMAEVWRKSLDLPLFSDLVCTRLEAATHWLFNMTQIETGDAPNLGANDGARLLPLTGGDYRDFRPSVQLASALFLKKAAYDKGGDWDQPLKWLGIKKPSLTIKEPLSLDMPLGGYGILRNKDAFVLLNYPKFRFRPSQCDALNVDFWRGGENLLRDGGTFSYNAGQEAIDYYGGTQSHNTVQFDGHQQMLRLSRFLLGDWLKTNSKQELKAEERETSIAAGYEDSFNCQHTRTVKLTNQNLLVEDQLSGFKCCAVVRWRLSPGDWRINGHQISNDEYVIAIDSNVDISRLELIEGRESRYYYLEETVPVIEIEINKPGIIKMEFRF
ncbi:MAG: heparinase II/III-family protein [Opitutaceae bacterium]|nr:heparinase II/III-family protein [Opitutaceae bacterium]